MDAIAFRQLARGDRVVVEYQGASYAATVVESTYSDRFQKTIVVAFDTSGAVWAPTAEQVVGRVEAERS